MSSGSDDAPDGPADALSGAEEEEEEEEDGDSGPIPTDREACRDCPAADLSGRGGPAGDAVGRVGVSGPYSTIDSRGPPTPEPAPSADRGSRPA